MPDVKKGESRNSYIKRCVPLCMEEGLSPKAALGKCEGMYDEKWGQKKPKTAVHQLLEK